MKHLRYFWIHIFTLFSVLGYALVPHQGDYADSVVWLPTALQPGAQFHTHNDLTDFQALIRGNTLNHTPNLPPAESTLEHPETYYGIANASYHLPPKIWVFPIFLFQGKETDLALGKDLEWPQPRPPTATQQTLKSTVLLI